MERDSGWVLQGVLPHASFRRQPPGGQKTFIWPESRHLSDMRHCVRWLGMTCPSTVAQGESAGPGWSPKVHVVRIAILLHGATSFTPVARVLCVVKTSQRQRTLHTENLPTETACPSSGCPLHGVCPLLDQNQNKFVHSRQIWNEKASRKRDRVTCNWVHLGDVRLRQRSLLGQTTNTHSRTATPCTSTSV